MTATADETYSSAPGVLWPPRHLEGVCRSVIAGEMTEVAAAPAKLGGYCTGYRPDESIVTRAEQHARMMVV